MHVQEYLQNLTFSSVMVGIILSTHLLLRVKNPYNNFLYGEIDFFLCNRIDNCSYLQKWKVVTILSFCIITGLIFFFFSFFLSKSRVLLQSPILYSRHTYYICTCVRDVLLLLLFFRCLLCMIEMSQTICIDDPSDDVQAIRCQKFPVSIRPMSYNMPIIMLKVKVVINRQKCKSSTIMPPLTRHV